MLEESLKSEAGSDEDSAAADCSKVRFSSTCVVSSASCYLDELRDVPYALLPGVGQTFQSSLEASNSRTGPMTFGKG